MPKTNTDIYKMYIGCGGKAIENYTGNFNFEKNLNSFRNLSSACMCKVIKKWFNDGVRLRRWIIDEKPCHRWFIVAKITRRKLVKKKDFVIPRSTCEVKLRRNVHFGDEKPTVAIYGVGCKINGNLKFGYSKQKRLRIVKKIIWKNNKIEFLSICATVISE